MGATALKPCCCQPCKNEYCPETASTLEVLKNIPSEKLDQPCKDEYLCELALSITDWQSLASFLGLTLAEELEIQTNYSNNVRKQRIEMLRKWRNKRGGRATYRKLVEVLLKMNETDLAEKLCNLIWLPQMTGGLEDSTSNDSQIRFRIIRCRYANKLREKYRSGFPTFLTLQWPPPPTYKVFNLAMIAQRVLRYGPDDEMVSLLQKGNVDDVVSLRNQVTLEEVSDSLHSKGRHIILIEGAPGAGKSTLAWHLCSGWERGQLFQDFEVVLFVQLREQAIQSAKCLEDLFPAESLSTNKEIVSAIQCHDGQQVLIILDSWDEFIPGLQKKSIIKNLICNPSVLSMQSSALIITSRPIATAQLQRFITTRIEIAGFLRSEIKQYFIEAIGDPELVRKLSDRLRERPVIEASCYLPLNTAIVTHLFLALNHTLPDTLHGVFTSLVINCIKRHLERQAEEGEDIPEISSLDHLPLGIQEHFHSLCKLAYHGVRENKATFSSADLQLFELPTQLSTLSLMQGVASFTALGQSKLYNFLHLSTQELLAAFFISKMKPQEQIKIFCELFDQPRFGNVFKFYAAFTKLQVEGIRHTVSNIVKSKRNILILSLLHCLYEAQDDSICQFVVSHLHNKLDLSEQSLNPVDCLSLGYFVSSVCSTTSEGLTLKLTIDRLDDYCATLLVRELSKHTSSQPQKAAKTGEIINLNLELEKGGTCFTVEHAAIISKLGLYLKALE